MLQIIDDLLRTLDRKERAALATVIDLEGSPEARVSAKALIHFDGTGEGDLGGHLQELVLPDCLEVLEDRQPRIARYEVPGGAVRVFLEPVEDRPRLLIVGAGHISQHLAKLGHMIGFAVGVVDDRPEFTTPNRFPDVETIEVGDMAQAIQRFGISGDTYVVLVPRSHEQGDAAIRQVVRSGAAYIGMIGSRRRAEAMARDLQADGFTPEEIGEIRSPIGLKIGAESPEEIAVAIAAELISVKRSRSGSVDERR